MADTNDKKYIFFDKNILNRMYCLCDNIQTYKGAIRSLFKKVLNSKKRAKTIDRSCLKLTFVLDLVASISTTRTSTHVE